ncbi:MAG: antitoxin VbhA family protein [Prevotellaceae bacterium]|jgi:putative transcriptional regulator|nr:antitoxin VbhA family protein [Prevotellaceae bacterium]
MYTPIEIDRNALTMMGVPFPDLETLESVAYEIGSNMYEGFEPTPELLLLYLDLRAGKISNKQLVEVLKQIA